MENKETFNYTYSAKQQEEIKNIRKKYAMPEEDKMEQLRKLDRGVTQKATMAAIIMGTVGALTMGFGMSLIMTDLSETLSFLQKFDFFTGIVIGFVGMILVGFAYPLYNLTLKKEREKVSAEILRLTDELLKS